ncbi:hypothetical protein AGMMS50296_6210 [Alphaproteobacteria bacterium]|nr:hypothetical protein AGMMS50296_6210 [Alphaproteobacteria bacterium]
MGGTKAAENARQSLVLEQLPGSVDGYCRGLGPKERGSFEPSHFRLSQIQKLNPGATVDSVKILGDDRHVLKIKDPNKVHARS